MHASHAAWVAAIEATVYDVVPRGELPVLDPSLSIKKLIVPHRYQTQVYHFLKRYNNLIPMVYISGYFLRIATVFVDVHLGKWTAVLSFILQVPAVICVIIEFRVALLKLLVKTYDFWYYFFVNCMWAGCFVWYFGDLRAAIVPVMWTDVQTCTLLDSYLRELRMLIVSAWIWCGFVCGLLVAIAFDVVEVVHGGASIITTRNLSISIKEVLLNAIGTTIVVVIRVLYRKSQALMRSNDRMAQCIVYRWPMKIEQRPAQHDPRISSFAPRQWHRQRHVFDARRLQLGVSTRSQPYKANDIVFPPAIRWYRRGLLQRLVRLCGSIGLGSTAAVFFVRNNGEMYRWAAVVGYACTSVYCSVLVCFYQSALLKRICGSFDFVWISLQLSMCSLCYAALYRWQLASILSVLSCWHWMHLVMTVDALTPIMRQWLDFREWFQGPVLLLFLVAALLLWLDIYVFLWSSESLLDLRIVQIPVGSKSFELHAIPFMFSRLVTVCLWSVRMIYRLFNRDSDSDLAVIQGNVEYDALFQRRRPKRTRSKAKPGPTPHSSVVAPQPFASG